MKLGYSKNKNRKDKSDKQKFAYDCETSYGNSLLPTVTVSFKDVTSEPNLSEKSTKPISLPSSLTQTTAPCEMCHRKAKRLFSVDQHGLIYFVCHTCYKVECIKRSMVAKSLIDLTNLVENPQLKVEKKQFKSRSNKRKHNRKNK